MKNISKFSQLFFPLFLLSLFFSPSAFAASKTFVLPKSSDLVNERPYVANEVVVKFKTDKIDLNSNFSPLSSLRKLIFDWTNSYDTEDTLKKGNILILKIKKGQLIDEVINTLQADSNVEYAEPNYTRQPSSINTDDTYKTNLWGLDNSGQTLTLSSGTTSIGTSGADISMSEAWALSTGLTEVTVAVIDSGVAYNHPDLTTSMWDGTNCKDESGNVLGSCLHGYDFVDNDKNPLPTNSTHGTHIAGTIAAAYNNGVGIAGVAPRAKIMALRTDFTVSSLVKAIDFATQNGAKIINASYRGPDFSQAEYDAINRFRVAGGIFVTAAGNEATDNDVTHSYPSDYDLSDIISVAATDQKDNLASFSNFGATSVDIAAPGENIYSTVDETPIVNFNFNNLSNGQLPATWTTDNGSSWGAFNVGGTGPANSVVWADLTDPYAEGVNSIVTSNTVDLSSASNAKFEFLAYCDTEFTDPSLGGDYMALEISSDGTNFTEYSRWNRYSIYAITGTSTNFFDNLSLPSQYLTNSFKYRFRWVTDSNGSRGGGQGCLIDDLKLLTYTDGSNGLYDYMDGTSMAAPHVAGLAGYLWSVKPSATSSEIIANILNNGDALPSLSGKILTGRRINAYSSLISLGVSLTGPVVSGISDDNQPVKSKTFTWTSTTPSTDQYRFLIDQSAVSTPSGLYSTQTSTTYSSGNGTFYLHVQAKDLSDTEGNVKTVSFVLDNLGPSPTLTNNSQSSFTLSYGENLYSDLGTSFVDNSNFSARFNTTSDIGITDASYSSQSINIVLTTPPLAGSQVSLKSGSSYNFYDSAGNSGGTLAVIYDGDNWWLNPSNLNIASTNISGLVTTGQFALTGGSSPSAASSLTVQSNLTLTIGSTDSNSSIGLTAGTIISELTDQNFDATQISASVIDVATISNVGQYTPQSAIQWGIVGTTLKFGSPITINIYLGSSFNGQTLNIFRSPSLSSGWTTDGLSATTCNVYNGYCSFSATQASYYLAAIPYGYSTPIPTSVPSNNNGNNNNNNQSSAQNHDAPQCHESAPVIVPDLFKIITTKGSAKIVYTPVNEKITGYAVIYGLKKGDERYAAMISPINNNQGEQSFTINKLNPKSTYYFKVTAYNGCTSGPWSDWIPAKADGKHEVHKYKTTIKNKIKTLINIFK